MHHTLDMYLKLIGSFVGGIIGADEFESQYLQMFKSDESRRDERVFLVLDRLFSDVDEFCADADLRKKVGGIDEQELLAYAREAYEALLPMAGGAGGESR